MFGPFVLQWRAPSPNPPIGEPLPAGITRSYINTPSGPLELLTALPSNAPLSSQSSSSNDKPPLFFAHGGFGCASVWLSYLTFFLQRGYPCYAVSYRGHGNSWYPGFWRMYFTGRGKIADDLVAGIEEAERRETDRRRSKNSVKMVLISHSAGGALSQYVLSRGLITVDGFCMFASVPGFGSWSCYKYWLPTAPFHFYYRFFHPRYLLARTQQIHAAFFTPQTPTPIVQALQRLLSPYESMCWPMQALFPFVTGPDVLQRIVGWKQRKTASSLGIASRMLVLAAQHDVLCTPPVLLDAAKRYRTAFYHCLRAGRLPGVSAMQDKCETSDWDEGVQFKVVEGVAHHLQNEEEWEKGAEEVLKWLVPWNTGMS